MIKKWLKRTFWMLKRKKRGLKEVQLPSVKFGHGDILRTGKFYVRTRLYLVRNILTS